MKFEKNGIIYIVTDVAQIDAFKSSEDWHEVIEEEEEEEEEVKKVRKSKASK